MWARLSAQPERRSDAQSFLPYDLLTEGFGPGFNGPLLPVVQVGSPADTAALAQLTETLQSEPGVAAVVPFPSQPGAKVAIVEVIPTTSPQDTKTSELGLLPLSCTS